MAYLAYHTKDKIAKSQKKKKIDCYSDKGIPTGIKKFLGNNQP